MLRLARTILILGLLCQIFHIKISSLGEISSFQIQRFSHFSRLGVRLLANQLADLTVNKPKE